MDRDYQCIISLINDEFLKSYNTVLVGGFEEPFYQSFQSKRPAEIQYTRDYIRSAMHELAHWCVAGKERRELDDYGYWYAEDGRSQNQQNMFFKVETKPQAIEWAFSIVSGIQFEVSVDNLNNDVEGVETFIQDVKLLILDFVENGFSKRVDKVLKLISSYNGIDDYLQHISDSIKQSK